MTPFVSEGGKTFKARVYGSCCVARPRQCKAGGHVRTLATDSKAEAKRITACLRKLRKRPAYLPILDAFIARAPGITAQSILAASQQRGGLRTMLRQLRDVDLSPIVERFHAALTNKVADDTRDHYKSAVRFFVSGKFPRSRLTPEYCQDVIDAMEDVRPATVRKRGMGMRRFTKYLRKQKILRRDPMRDVELPTPDKPRDLHLEPWEAQKLADAQPWPYSGLSALLAGTGIEVSVALALTRRDVDLRNKQIRAAGTKTWNRDRVVKIADWAWPYVERLTAGLHPDTRLFAAIPDRWYAADAHNLAIYGDEDEGVKGLADASRIYQGYTMRDARHTYAVRATRAGTPPDVVAAQLGHVNSVLVARVYGKYKPNQEERAKWERAATSADAEREKERAM